MGRVIVCGLFVAVLLLAARPVYAERAAVVRFGGDPGIAEPTRREAVAKLSDLLRAQGLEVMPAAEAARRVAAARCEGAGCGVRLRAALGVDLLATVGLWVGPDTRGVHSVVVGLVRDATYTGSAELGDSGLAAALERALAAARSRQALGPGPWLRVEGEPRGARIVVDGTDWGVLPNEAATRPGEHRVVVQLEGYVAEERTVRLHPGASEPVVVSVRLAPVEPASPRAVSRPRQRPASPPARRATRIERPVVGPLLLGGVGVAGLGVALGGLLTTDCRVEHGGRCRVGTVADETWVLVYGAGGAVTLGAALAWHFFGGTARPTGTSVGLGPGSFYVRGEF
jgi:hypothetical protein